MAKFSHRSTEFTFEVSNSVHNDTDELSIGVYESLSGSYGSHVWPCSIVLASFIAQRTNLFRGHILELGCGCGLPGLLAAKLGALHVTLTDSSENTDVLNSCKQSVIKNSVSKNCCVLDLDWGKFSSTYLSLSQSLNVDVILGADCFYNSKDSDSLLSTVRLFMESNSNVVFYMTYQDRSCQRSLRKSLEFWGLTATLIKWKPSSSKCTYDNSTVTKPNDTSTYMKPIKSSLDNICYLSLPNSKQDLTSVFLCQIVLNSACNFKNVKFVKKKP